jgi:hypothetical protein
MYILSILKFYVRYLLNILCPYYKLSNPYYYILKIITNVNY